MLTESNLGSADLAPGAMIGISGAGGMGAGIAQIAALADSGPSAQPVPDRQSAPG